jgi:YD repeat-containing protein
MRKAFPIIGGLCLLLPLSHAVAAGTIAYTYDAKGRLVRAVASGGPNNGSVTTYDHDNADNRKSTKTVGASR